MICADCVGDGCQDGQSPTFVLFEAKVRPLFYEEARTGGCVRIKIKQTQNKTGNEHNVYIHTYIHTYICDVILFFGMQSFKHRTPELQGKFVAVSSCAYLKYRTQKHEGVICLVVQIPLASKIVSNLATMSSYFV